MQSGEIKKRFGRCPYCRAMVYKNPGAAVFYCSKCQTPIRGKCSKPTDQADRWLSRTDELDPCHREALVLNDDGNQPELFNSFTSCSCVSGNRRGVVAPAPSSPSSPIEGFRSARHVHSQKNGARRSPRFDDGNVGLNELGELRPLSRRTRQPWSSDSNVLRHGVFMSTDSDGTEPASSGLTAAARRGAWFFRRVESSHLARAPPLEETGVGCSWSSSGGGSRERRRKGYCRPVLGGAPFVVCGGCFQLLQAPATTTTTQPSRRRRARLRCGGCGEVVELTVPTTISSSAHRTTGPRGAGAPKMPLHVALGYSSPDPLLQSRRY